MNATTSEVPTLHVSRLHLVAMPSAVPVAREFVHQALRHWKLDDYAADAALMMTELVSNAIKATGFTDRQPRPWEVTAQHVIAVQLRAIGDVLYIEVWDRSPLVPIKQDITAEAEGGRGLHLVEALSEKWGTYWPPAGGKIVWAMKALIKLPSPALDGSTLQLRVPDDLQPQPGPVTEQASTALMQRVLDGLRQVL
ncbi:anti-sigma regulatory factor (Ser/Thr protein kinase) [Streptomyces aurantiacus]|uniref:ATP-binding protein n=1 Tax=Streptomyces aurantiacus TaxID=47760 RepID=UPI0027940B43|nr:ATP-binding protein [Streptomyces aurantiacus]MDQ0776323.1 anti-sigma regulatory factor (Ser/Thr protein kinase) [Streptomyces aurantiacus]